MTMSQGILAQCSCDGGIGLSLRQVIGLGVLIGLWVLILWTWRIVKEQGVLQMKGMVGKIAVVLVLAAAVGFVLVAKRGEGTTTAPVSAGPASAPASAAALPRLVDLGSKSCIPCKMMAPILEQLRAEQAGKLRVEFIDVHVDAAAAEQYAINLIPTQIFYDAAGKEVWRHEGFMAKEDILAKCRELGFALAAGSSAEPPAAKENLNG